MDPISSTFSWWTLLLAHLEGWAQGSGICRVLASASSFRHEPGLIGKHSFLTCPFYSTEVGTLGFVFSAPRPAGCDWFQNWPVHTLGPSSEFPSYCLFCMCFIFPDSLCLLDGTYWCVGEMQSILGASFSHFLYAQLFACFQLPAHFLTTASSGPAPPHKVQILISETSFISEPPRTHHCHRP